MSSNLHEIIIKLKDEATKGIQKIEWNFAGLKSSIERNREGLESLQVASGIAVAGVTALGAYAVKTASEMQNLRTSMNTLTGSAENGKEIFLQLQKEAATTPFDSKWLAQATSTMLAFGIETEKVIPSLRMLGDISMWDANKLNSLSLVFGQVRSAGKLTGGDLLQLINVGFNPLQVISKKTGKSMAELRSEMEKWKITFEMVEDAMKSATQEWGLFYKGMENASKTFSGAMANLGDTVDMTLASIVGFANGETIKGGLIDQLTNGIRAVVPYLEKIQAWAEKNPELAGKILIWVGAVAGLTLAFTTLALALPAVSAGFALLFSPITLIIGALTALGVAYTTNFMGFKEIVDSVVGWISENLQIFGAFLAEMWNTYWPPFIETVTLLWETLKVVFETAFLVIKQHFQAFLDELKFLWDVFWPAITEATRILWESIKAIFSTAFRMLKTIVDSGLKVIKWVFDIFAGVLTGDWSRVWEWMKWIVTGILWGIGSFIKETLTGLLQWIGGIFWIDLVSSFTNAFERAKEATIGIVTWMAEKIKGILENIKRFIGGIIDGITGAGDRAREVQASVHSGGGNGGISPRALGGSVVAGERYMVGERWPELFVPNTNGYIVPNNQLSGGATININMGSVIVQNEADENRLAEKISQRLAKEARLYKLGIA